MSCLLFEQADHVAIVRLNRSEKRNSLNPEMVVRMASVWEQVQSDESIRVVVITGEGEAFCAGGDLGKLIPIINGAKQPEDEWETTLASNRKLLTRALLRDIDVVKPVIAAINGDAVAGGMELVLGTDIRIAARGARLGLQEVKFGVFPGGGGSVRLPAQLPHAIALEMLVSGELRLAEDLESYGLINHVVDREDVFQTAMDIAQKVAANAPLSVQAVRKSARDSVGLETADALRRENEISRPIWKSKDAREGPRAFVEKRPPRFIGR